MIGPEPLPQTTSQPICKDEYESMWKEAVRAIATYAYNTDKSLKNRDDACEMCLQIVADANLVVIIDRVVNVVGLVDANGLIREARKSKTEIRS